MRKAKSQNGDDADAYTVAEFCRRNRISVSFYYKLKDQGRAPDEMRFGTKVLIGKEAAVRWRQQQAEITKAEAQAKPPAEAA
jgi:hypothetical protein